jgi:hypothetical protein
VALAQPGQARRRTWAQQVGRGRPAQRTRRGPGNFTPSASQPRTGRRSLPRELVVTELCQHPVEEIGVPWGLCTKLTVFSAARRAIVNLGRDAPRGGQRLLELRYLLDRHEVILDSGKDQHIVLNPLRDAGERVLLQLRDRVEWVLGS